MNRRRLQDGFTLVELLVAFAILALSLTAVFRIFSDGLLGTKLADDYGTAIALAESTLTQVGIDPDLPARPGMYEGQFDDRFSWRLEIASLDDALDTTRLERQLYAIRVALSVHWDDSGSGRSVSLEKIHIEPPLE